VWGEERGVLGVELEGDGGGVAGVGEGLGGELGNMFRVGG